MHFRAVKDKIALPLHWLGGVIARYPESFGRAILGALGASGRAAYFAPGSHVRRTLGDFCRATGRSDPWPIYSRMVGNLQETARHYSALYRYGRSRLLEQTVMDPTLAREFQRMRDRKGGLILLVSHSAAAVLGSAGLSAACPTVLLVREPRSSVRSQLMMEYIQKLGPEFILSRNAPPALVMRKIMRALRDGKVIVGTTDVIDPQPDSVETQAFGQRVYLPSWPAKISAHLGVPIVPGFIHLEGHRIRLLAEESYAESDLQKSTERWMASFEGWFRRYPSDWVFMLDRRWAFVLAAAARRAQNQLTQPVSTNPHATSKPAI